MILIYTASIYPTRAWTEKGFYNVRPCIMDVSVITINLVSKDIALHCIQKIFPNSILTVQWKKDDNYNLLSEPVN